MLKAIIFDVDGTLADTENVHRVCFNRAFATAGVPWHWDRQLYGELLKVTGGKERIAHFIDTARPGTVAARDRDALIAGLHRTKTRFYERIVQQGAIKLRPGVENLIAAARGEGLKLAIATTTSLPNVLALLKSTLEPDAPNFFAAIAAGDSVAHKKPAPDIYVKVLEQLGLPASACIAVEDSHNGLRSALAAGLTTIVTPSIYTAEEDFSGAARVVSSLAQLSNGQPGSAPGNAILNAFIGIHNDCKLSDVQSGS